MASSSVAYAPPFSPVAAGASASAPGAPPAPAFQWLPDRGRTPSPAPGLKHRRTSLAVPPSARLVPPASWSFRDDTSLGALPPDGLAVPPRAASTGSVPGFEEDIKPRLLEPPLQEHEREKKVRRKWTPEETQALVDGCRTHGVGNWKAMLKDPNLDFNNRSAVDLKDRFRTYFPDAYKQHYPNAKTHLSSKVRATLPDGSSLFEKTRGKKRRPFTPAEDAALRDGYARHGTVWATIVKDPAFQAQGRKSTDLRDRFRNAFPELYQAAGYKPRPSAARKRMGAPPAPAPAAVPVRAATDDTLVGAGRRAAGPARRRRALTNEGVFRGGVQSVPTSSAVSDDEGASDNERDEFGVPSFAAAHAVHSSPAGLATPAAGPSSVPRGSEHLMDAEMDDASPPPPPPLGAVDDFGASFLSDASSLWPLALDAPLHALPWAAPGSVASPSAASHLSGEYFRAAASPGPSRALAQAHVSAHAYAHAQGAGPPHATIGKSVWAPDDWLAGHLAAGAPYEHARSASSSLARSPAPSSPFSLASASLSASLSFSSHGVLDRYDLSGAPVAGWASEHGPPSALSDPDSPGGAPFRGFTHHSSSAGDLIFGARTHQPPAAGAGPGFGFGLAAWPGALGLAAWPGALGLALPGIAELPRADAPAPGAPFDGLAALLDLPPPTPPGTPGARARRAPPAPHRSASQPPAEARALSPPPAPRPPLTPTRSLSLFSGALLASDPELAFLDLPAAPAPPVPAHAWAPSRALDLATAPAPAPRTHPPPPPRGLPPASFAHATPAALAALAHMQRAGAAPPRPATPARHTLHHRGQSAVSPQDLILRPGGMDDARRKRASWDGMP